MVTRRDLWEWLIQQYGRNGYPNSKEYVTQVQTGVFSLFGYDEEGAPAGVKVNDHIFYHIQFCPRSLLNVWRFCERNIFALAYLA